MVRGLKEDLYDTIMSDCFDPNCAMTKWNACLHIGYCSDRYDTGASGNWDYFNGLEYRIPAQIVRILRADPAP